MTSVHTVRPTDLVALVSYDGRVYPNEAVTRDRAGSEGSPHPLEAALEQWLSFATGRHTWISVRGATLRGLASARKRGSRAAWELDCLIDAADDDSGVLMSLLDQVAADAGRAGAEKVFLRVAAGSPAIEVACRSGFAGYLAETLFAGRGARGPAGEGLRRGGRADAYPTFRLYNTWAPERVRRAEGATFREWQASREALAQGRGTRQFVIENDGRIAGWLRIATPGEVGRFDLMADPAAPELLDSLLDAALSRLAGQSVAYTLVPEFAPGLGERLERRGFEARGEFVVLARRTSRPVAVPELAAAAPVQSLLA